MNLEQRLTARPSLPLPLPVPFTLAFRVPELKDHALNVSPCLPNLEAEACSRADLSWSPGWLRTGLGETLGPQAHARTSGGLDPEGPWGLHCEVTGLCVWVVEAHGRPLPAWGLRIWRLLRCPLPDSHRAAPMGAGCH